MHFISDVGFHGIYPAVLVRTGCCAQKGMGVTGKPQMNPAFRIFGHQYAVGQLLHIFEQARKLLSALAGIEGSGVMRHDNAEIRRAARRGLNYFLEPFALLPDQLRIQIAVFARKVVAGIQHDEKDFSVSEGKITPAVRREIVVPFTGFGPPVFMVAAGKNDRQG